MMSNQLNNMSELQFQIKLFNKLSRLEAVHPSLFTYAVEFGENNTNFVQLRELKAKGMRRGISDLHILGGGNMLFVELKTATGVQSKFQKHFQAKCEMNGFEYILLKASTPVDEFVNIIMDKLGL
jgi:hypothetical protein